MSQAEARAAVARNLPFVAEIVVCQGRDIAALISKNPFKGLSVRPGVVRFVSVLSGRTRLTPATPMRFPPSGPWLMKILAKHNRFVIGTYRRHMKVIGYLGALDRLYGVPVTTRNWNTIAAIGKVLRNDPPAIAIPVASQTVLVGIFFRAGYARRKCRERSPDQD